VRHTVLWAAWFILLFLLVTDQYAAGGQVFAGDEDHSAAAGDASLCRDKRLQLAAGSLF